MKTNGTIIAKDVQKELKRYRKKLGIRQFQTANMVGMTAANLSQIETGRYQIKLQGFLDILHFYSKHDPAVIDHIFEVIKRRLYDC